MPARQSLAHASSYALALLVFYTVDQKEVVAPQQYKLLRVRTHSLSPTQHRAAMAIVPSSAVTLAGAEQAVRAGIAAAEKSGGLGIAGCSVVFS